VETHWYRDFTLTLPGLISRRLRFISSGRRLYLLRMPLAGIAPHATWLKGPIPLCCPTGETPN